MELYLPSSRDRKSARSNLFHLKVQRLLQSLCSLAMTLLALTLGTNRALAWGQAGHGRIAVWAAEVAPAHPLLSAFREVHADALKSFLGLLDKSRYELEYLSNIPDTYWRRSDLGAGSLGDPTHYFNAERTVKFPANFFKDKIALEYSSARARNKEGLFFKSVGTLPWRAQQFADLTQGAWENYPKLESISEKLCDSKDKEWTVHPTVIALTFAGLMAHFTGDASMPYHASEDWDGEETGQRGIHWYFESMLVDAINEWTLDYGVAQKAKRLLEAGADVKNSPANLRAVAASQYGDTLKRAEVAGLVLALLADSYHHIKELAKLDATYAIPTVREALKLTQCAELDSVKRVKADLKKLSGEKKEAFLNSKLVLKRMDKDPACRRDPRTLVNKEGFVKGEERRTVAQWHQDLIQERLAISAALTADIWVRGWLKGHAPLVCSTRQYPHKPSFISPTDPLCSGYAMDEGQKNFAVPITSFNVKAKESCVRFE